MNLINQHLHQMLWWLLWTFIYWYSQNKRNMWRKFFVSGTVFVIKFDCVIDKHWFEGYFIAVVAVSLDFVDNSMDWLSNLKLKSQIGLHFYGWFGNWMTHSVTALQKNKIVENNLKGRNLFFRKQSHNRDSGNSIFLISDKSWTVLCVTFYLILT